LNRPRKSATIYATMANDTQILARNLRLLETRVLLSYARGDELTAKRIERELAFRSAQACGLMEHMGRQGGRNA